MPPNPGVGQIRLNCRHLIDPLNMVGLGISLLHHVFHSYIRAVLEIMVSVQTLPDHLGILSYPKKFESDIWLSTTSCSFHTHSDDPKSFLLKMFTYAFIIC